MFRRSAGWGRLRLLIAALVLALPLAASPAIEAVKHGPGAVAAEADHPALHPEHGHSQDMPSAHHDAGDHDHVSMAVLAPPVAEFHAPPENTLRSKAMLADGTIRDGPRRPPRSTLT